MNKLKKFREAEGLSHGQLTLLMWPERVVSKVNVCQIETGVRKPWPDFKRRAARVFAVSEEEIFGGECK